MKVLKKELVTFNNQMNEANKSELKNLKSILVDV